MASQKGETRLFIFTFLSPACILFFVLVLLPFLCGIPYAFTNWNGMSDSYEFVGLKNFAALFSNQYFYQSMGNTFYFALFTTIVANMLGLLFAIGVYKSNILNNLMRTVFFMPFVLSLILATYIWKYIYSDVYSTLFHTITPLATQKNAMLAISIMAVWRDSGYCMIIYIAALQGIPEDYIEAAKIDGAGSLVRFQRITLPLLVPAFTTNVSLLLSWGFKVFEYPMAATAGGPGCATRSIAMLVYENLFANFKAGYGQAIALVMTIVLSSLTLLVTRFFSAREVEM